MGVLAVSVSTSACVVVGIRPVNELKSNQSKI